MDSVVKPQIRARNEGEAIWFLGAITFIKASAETTGGAFGLIEQVIPAGFASPYHVHHNEDEAFYVVEGGVTFVSDGKATRVGAGAFVFGPREIPHGFRIEGTSPSRLLILATPAGFEGFVREAGDPAKDLVTPPPGPPDLERLGQLAAKHSIDLLGPLPL